MSKGKSPVKKAISIICTVLTVIIVAFAVGILINMIVCRAKNKPVSFFGTSFAIVQTNSMEPYIMTGDLIVFKSCSINDVKVGDYIVFVAGDGFSKSIRGQSIVHEVIEITEDGIKTQGKNRVTNPGPDKDLVTAKNFLGKCTSNSAGWGRFFRFLSKYGIIIIIAIVVVPFVIKQAMKIAKLSKQRQAEKAAADDGSNLNDGIDNKPPDET